MKKLTTEQFHRAIADGEKALFDNPSKTFALVYPFGFVPNSYKYPAPAERVRVNADHTVSIEKYDRKRSHGEGRYITLWKRSN